MRGWKDEVENGGREVIEDVQFEVEAEEAGDGDKSNGDFMNTRGPPYIFKKGEEN